MPLQDLISTKMLPFLC